MNISFHITEAAAVIESVDVNLARQFRTKPFSRYAVAETVKEVLNKRGYSGDVIFDFIVARIEMHKELRFGEEAL